MKIIKNGDRVMVILNNGGIVQGQVTSELFESLCNAKTDEEVIMLLPCVSEVMKQKIEVEDIFSRVEKSHYLSRSNNSIYWKSISELSMPADLVEAVLKAEEENNTDALTAYKNFWTLMSLNPDSRCRQNLFWFLNKWGMKISKSGLFIGYRNVDVFRDSDSDFYSQDFCDKVKKEYEIVKQQKKSPANYYVYYNDLDLIRFGAGTKTHEYFVAEFPNYIHNLKEVYDELKAVNFKAKNCGSRDTVYTDHHSHKFRIQIGKLVSMPREECDCVQENQCSTGLHLANAEWLTEGYFGEQGLVCLCNPAKVCAVPYDAGYGKLRTCEYLPIALVEYDDNGKVIPYNVDNGFDSKWVKEVLYSGNTGTEECPTYVLEVPDVPEINKSRISSAVYNIAKEYINKH